MDSMPGYGALMRMSRVCCSTVVLAMELRWTMVLMWGWRSLPVAAVAAAAAATLILARAMGMTEVTVAAAIAAAAAAVRKRVLQQKNGAVRGVQKVRSVCPGRRAEGDVRALGRRKLG